MRLSVNGHGYDVHAEVGATLAEALREELSLTGTKIACAEGHCGACTVLVDGEPVLSCITLVHTLDGAEVTTIEGLRDHPMVDAFVRSSTTNAPLVLSPSSFTALGPRPLRTTGCSGCFDYGTAEGRVNDIVIDPMATNVAYLASVGGGVWKTTTCCSASTSWSAVTDDPLLSTISIDSLTIDPNNHNTIYAGTGDLNYGSFSMGSQGILKSTDAGATWTLQGASVFGPGLPLPAGQFPQYQAVGKVRSPGIS